jgi:hypothetical protein
MWWSIFSIIITITTTIIITIITATTTTTTTTNRVAVAQAVSCLDYGLDDRGSIPDRWQRNFVLAPASRPALGPTQPPFPWVKRGRVVMLTTRPYLEPRLRMGRSYTSSPPKAPSWRVAGHLYPF